MKALASTRLMSCLFIAGFIAPTAAQSLYDGYYNYLNQGDWPDHAITYYSEDIQGIDHSDDYWFISNIVGTITERGRIRKFPVGSNLTNPVISAVVFVEDTPLLGMGVEEFKELDTYKNPFNNQWYVVCGVGGSTGGIAFFDENLTLVGLVPFAGRSEVGWCAVDAQGRILNGENRTNFLTRYTANWQAIAAGNAPTLTPESQINLLDESGLPLTMIHFQGGEFTPEGDKLYIVTGYSDDTNDVHGIHVFDARNSSGPFQRLRRSTISPSLFQYQFNPSGSLTGEEPEGLTFWDLNDGRAPGISGELHVLVLDNNIFDHQFWLKHYTRRIYVDASYAGNDDIGDPGRPKKTVSAGAALAFPDMELHIAPGSYAGAVTLTNRLRLVKQPGPGVVRIGQ
jgi:hypothetical protein